MDQIQEGRTHKREVRRLLGEPGFIRGGSGATESWYYTYKGIEVRPLALIPIFGVFMQQGEVKEAGLTLVFDHQGILQRKDWEVSVNPFPRELKR